MGHGVFESFFYIVVPIISGGVGEGILPLSAGYAEIQGVDPGKFIAMVAPAAMLGNVTAIVCAGILRRYAIKHPESTGTGLPRRAHAFRGGLFLHCSMAGRMPRAE